MHSQISFLENGSLSPIAQSGSIHRKITKIIPNNVRGYEPIAQFEGAQTPPDYLVRETKDGRLVLA
uniref:Uncharacterized protein n=1 Tax=Setaria digitata TaxID=48799 RepID=A0A915PY12_9BILA